MQLNPLTSAEEKIIINKGTEIPFTGEYNNFFAEGVYVCRRCNTPLYKSENKFDAHCGWPSFDQEIPGRVKHQPDPDGQRVEISCATCGAHLGHVFSGEHLTKTDTRHCVNSLSLKFIPKDQSTNKIIVLGGGCFWCLETIFNRLKGVNNITSGYAGGHTANPTYTEVSNGSTGHAEVIKIEYNPTIINDEILLEVFFALHDPTTLNQQGNDIGTQYRSLILYTSEQQKTAAENFIQYLTSEKTFTNPIVTEIKPLTVFYPAEDYHQNYYEQNTHKPYCQLVISPKIKKIEEKFATLLK